MQRSGLALRLRAASWRTRVALPIVFLVLLLAAALGTRASPFVLLLLIAMFGLAILLQHQVLGILALIVTALIVKYELGTGTEVAINPASLLAPALLGLWVVDMVRRKDLRLAPSRTNTPLLLFLLAGLLSLVVGIVYWDPNVPRSSNFTLVQLAQWAIFAFSAGAFWLMGNLVRDEAWLRRITWVFLALGGGLAILGVLPPTRFWIEPLVTYAIQRPPFWMLLAALALGQLFFNRELGLLLRLFLLLVLAAAIYYAFFLLRETASNWIGLAAVGGVLAWLRWPRLRVLVVILLLLLASSGFLTSAVYNFAGGDAEWQESGGSRLTLIGRAIEVTMRNPILGIGPAAYRPYARIKPLPYGEALWFTPNVSSHNNYVDLFAHVGLLGLGLFAWFAVEFARVGLGLRKRFTQGFAAGYLNSALATGAGALALMLFADWILPFVYNISFKGFQASVLVWLFLGGVVALEQIATAEAET